MTIPKASKTRLQIRQKIGYNLGAIIVSEVTDTKDDSSLWDTLGLSKGGDSEYNGAQVQINTTPTGSIVAGEQSWVSAFDSTEKDATMSPAFTDVLTDGDTYEMWLPTPGFTIGQVNEAINDAIIAATDECLQNKVTATTLKKNEIYEYDCLSSFVGLHTVEYEYDTGTKKELDNCEAAWTAGSSVTASLDTTIERVGSGCAKFVVASGAASGAVLGYKAISSTDLSGYDTVEWHMYSTIALTAGQLEFCLDDTAACISVTDTIAVPAMSASTWYKHSVAMTNPVSDTAIISIGIKQATSVDVGGCTLYIDQVDAIVDKSRIYKEINPDHWTVVPASTPLLKLDGTGYAFVYDNRLLRLSGYAIPAELSADATACTVDADYVVARATAQLLASKAASRELDPEDAFRRADWWFAIAERRLLQARTPIANNTRWVG